MKSPYGTELTIKDVLLCAPRGWGGIVRRLVIDLHGLGWDGEVHQVKEKFGELRFYVGEGSKAIFTRIDEATAESLRTCEMCGEPGSQREEDYWISTLCDTHKDKVQKP